MRSKDGKAIIACSSGGSNNAAIGIIRISDFKCPRQFNKFFNLDLGSISPRVVYLVDLLHEGELVDNCTIVFFQAPASYNGENILELSVHGNHLNIKRIIDLFVQVGDCRLAGPGEFTLRALQNKKLTLSQVEGLDLLLNANSALMFNQGMATLHGELHNSYVKLQKLFIQLKSVIELSIDFSDDAGLQDYRRELQRSFVPLFNHVNELFERSRNFDRSLFLPKIVIFGPVNAGKSSLFNQLLHSSRAIVSDIPGTTRDYLTENICLDNINFLLIDTAGLRSTCDSVEQLGIDHVDRLLREAFYKILVINPCDDEIDSTLLEHECDLVVATHADCADFAKKWHEMRSLFSNRKCLELSLLSGGPIEPVGPIGAKTENIINLAASKYRSFFEKNPIVIERQAELLGKIYYHLEDFKDTLESENDLAIISSELNLIQNDLFELIGIISTDSVLASIFKNFCIGK